MSPSGVPIVLEELDPFDYVESQAPIGPDSFRSELQELTRRVALDPKSWTASDQARMVELFDERAPTWVERMTETYLIPLQDALSRGGVSLGGRCLEVGTGTGLQTPTLQAAFSKVIATDVSAEMLQRSGRDDRSLIRTDGAHLAVATASVDAVVLVNVPLFIDEYLRVLRGAGAIVLASTRGPGTPIYLSPEDLLHTTAAHSDSHFHARHALAGQGEWTVLVREN